ncbi:hypothetical protein CVT26_007933 [Gymnopilus dilepis]|uniref:Uncharacterized protein n=1 Tax=Gymnopilus dilepis TaxID=231916 RepID=A0A409WW87_9AGAR|nr:hypothetical protein CVT26_007933 [Gymnopilus dilepis]
MADLTTDPTGQPPTKACKSSKPPCEHVNRPESRSSREDCRNYASVRDSQRPISASDFSKRLDESSELGSLKKNTDADSAQQHDDRSSFVADTIQATYLSDLT